MHRWRTPGSLAVLQMRRSFSQSSRCCPSAQSAHTLLGSVSLLPPLSPQLASAKAAAITSATTSILLRCMLPPFYRWVARSPLPDLVAEFSTPFDLRLRSIASVLAIIRLAASNHRERRSHQRRPKESTQLHGPHPFIHTNRYTRSSSSSVCSLSAQKAHELTRRIFCAAPVGRRRIC